MPKTIQVCTHGECGGHRLQCRYHQVNGDYVRAKWKLEAAAEAATDLDGAEDEQSCFCG